MDGWMEGRKGGKKTVLIQGRLLEIEGPLAHASINVECFDMQQNPR